MNILVIGCGRLGINLAHKLDKRGHEVSIISQNSSDLDNLKNFKGFTVVGVPIDEDVLQRAGVESCDAVAVVTSDDNINLMVSQMVKIIYNIPNVTARVFELSKKKLLNNMGIKVVSPTGDSTNVICDSLITNEISYNINIGDTIISVNYEGVPDYCIGKHINCIRPKPRYLLYGILKGSSNKFYFYKKDSEASNMIAEKGDRIVFNKILSNGDYGL